MKGGFPSLKLITRLEKNQDVDVEQNCSTNEIIKKINQNKANLIGMIFN
jgi:hypothetical protein